MAGIQIVYKLQMHIKLFFISYQDSKMKTCQKVQKHLLTRLFQKNKKVQFANILINQIKSIYMLVRK